MRLGLSKGEEFKTRYKHYRLSHGRRMVVPTSSKVKLRRLRARSLGRSLTRIRLAIEILNPRKEEKEIPIKKTKKIKKVCNVITVKSGVTWPSIVGTGKIREQKNCKDEGGNLARQDADYMVVMTAVANDHVESKIWFLDLGCSNHMTSQKVWFVDFDESRKSKVKLINNSSL